MDLLTRALVGPGLAAAIAGGPALAGDGLRIALVAPSEVHAGEFLEIVARVHVERGPAAPVMLSARAEGTAIEVVRGRFLRGDAAQEGDGTLVFRIPVTARGTGDGLVDVRVRSYACEERCVAVEARQTVALHVGAPRASAIEP